MFTWRKRVRADKATAHQIYGAIVSQARSPEFYLNCGVPDTVSGRFELIVLHVGLVVQRLGEGEKRHRELGRSVLEAFFEDMDRSLREMGVGDLAVPKKMKTAASAYFGRSQAYRDAMAGGDGAALRAALQRNVYADCEHPAVPDGLADYCLSASDHLRQITIAEPAEATDWFPSPPVTAGAVS